VIQKVLILFFLLNAACMSQPSTYEYADGNANLYLMTQTSLRYVPVTPQESSSGTYSGGNPITVAITQAQYNELKTIFDKAIDNKNIHIEKRQMLSGMITLMGDFENGQCILKPGCAEMATIEQKLKAIISK
jgi:hypothetical protein